MQAYVHTHATRPDGSRDSFATVTCAMRQRPAKRQRDSMKRASAAQVRFNGRWLRCYQEPQGAWLYIESQGERFRVLPIQGEG